MLERLRALGLTGITRCRLTRNRRVMVSYSRDQLRIHRGYVGASDEVLAAIVRFVRARSPAERLRARRELLAHPIATEPGARRRERMHADDAPAAAHLAEWHGAYNMRYFGGELRSVTIRVSRRMRMRLGHYCAGAEPEIAISRRHLRRHGWDAALETLLHEMVHQWQDERGIPIDHGPEFRRKARAVGIPPFARRLVAA